METILATAFGRVIDVQRGESSQLTKAAADIFAGSHEQNRTSGRFLSIVLSTCCQEYVIIKLVEKVMVWSLQGPHPHFVDCLWPAQRYEFVSA